MTADTNQWDLSSQSSLMPLEITSLSCTSLVSPVVFLSLKAFLRYFFFGHSKIVFIPSNGKHVCWKDQACGFCKNVNDWGWHLRRGRSGRRKPRPSPNKEEVNKSINSDEKKLGFLLLSRDKLIAALTASEFYCIWVPTEEKIRTFCVAGSLFSLHTVSSL